MSCKMRIYASKAIAAENAILSIILKDVKLLDDIPNGTNFAHSRSVIFIWIYKKIQ
jgi:hypothetical protein